MSKGALLHVGCGGASLPDWLIGYTETRLDIDESQCPDVVASMLDMGDIGDFDVLFCNHALEHVETYNVPRALDEFHRVLKDGGHAIVFVPDLEGVAPTDEVILESPSGGITGHDMIYGYGKTLKDHPHMAHRCGFVRSTLEASLQRAGFSKVVAQRLGNYNLLGAAVK